MGIAGKVTDVLQLLKWLLEKRHVDDRSCILGIWVSGYRLGEKEKRKRVSSAGVGLCYVYGERVCSASS